MYIIDGFLRGGILQCFANLFTSYVELSSVILIEITGQGAERLLCGEGERSSCRLELLPDW